MLNKELLLCGTSDLRYPPRMDSYTRARTVLITASNRGGGVDGIDFQFIGITPSRVEDSNGKVDTTTTLEWYLTLPGEMSSTTNYPAYATMFRFPYNPSTNLIKIRYENAGGGLGGKNSFYIGACIPVYNCGSCEVLESNDSVMKLMFTISDITKTCHIHLEQLI